METWSQGIHLLGRFNAFQAGCWLLEHGGQAALVEVPPYGRTEMSPAFLAQEAADMLNVQIKYCLCSHCHADHFSWFTLGQFTKAFPQASFILQRHFPKVQNMDRTFIYFDRIQRLALGGEPLFLIHAPKHSWSDTMIIFRGVIISGDWELNTIRSVHDGRWPGQNVPFAQRRQSIRRLITFTEKNNYIIHKVFSVHANDRREQVNFRELMLDTATNRKLW
ncbi:MBL fold metallo-hydrolase [bacterium]|nr:MBL fold metallo-hydrolase [bacterium]